MPHPLTADTPTTFDFNPYFQFVPYAPPQPFEELCHSAKNKRAKVIRTTTKTNNHQVAEQLKDLIEQKLQLLRLNTVTVLEDVGDVLLKSRSLFSDI